jgi:hypothetical protein
MAESGGGSRVQTPTTKEPSVLAFLLFLVLVAVALGLIGALVHGLIYLLAIGCTVFVIAVLIAGFKAGRRSRSTRRRYR